MKILKIQILMMVLLLAGQSLCLKAQRPDDDKLTPEERAELLTTRLKIALDLSDEQVAKVKQIQTDHFKKVETDRAEVKAKRDAARDKRDKQIKATEAELKKVLTADQFKKYMELKDKRKERKEKRDMRGR
ncbi:MAG: hypothetical protein PHQ65_13665 [Bacteroidales bacterium]|nr:hypothetical protein [Bacteroidales bacterium]MDD3666306.1 hypothetical protein [Bacteroidales bacterium]